MCTKTPPAPHTRRIWNYGKIDGFHTIPRDNRRLRRGGHVGGLKKRNQNSFVQGRPTWPLWRQVKTIYSVTRSPTKKLGGTGAGRVKWLKERNWFSRYLLNFFIGFSHDVVAYKLDGIFGNYLAFQGLRCDNNERILVLSNCSPQAVHQFRSERAFC